MKNVRAASRASAFALMACSSRERVGLWWSLLKSVSSSAAAASAGRAIQGRYPTLETRSLQYNSHRRKQLYYWKSLQTR